MDIFLDLSKNNKILHMYFDNPLVLQNCYIVALTPDNKTNNISRHFFYKDTGLYIFVFTNDYIYTYENFNYNDKDLYDMASKIDINKNTYDIDSNTFFCFVKKRSFGHCLCNVSELLNNNYLKYKNNIKPITGFTTNHIYDLINLYDSPIVLDKINTIYKIKELTIYPSKKVDWPWETNDQIIFDINERINSFINIDYIPCFIKTENNTSDNKLGSAFIYTNKMNYFFQKNNIKLIIPEKLSFNEILNILYNSKKIIVQWGALSFLPYIFCKNNKQKIIVLKHKNYEKENWDHPESYIISKSLDKNLDESFDYIYDLIND